MLINIDEEEMQKCIEATKDIKFKYDNDELPFNGMIVSSGMLNNELKLRIKITDIEKANEIIKAIIFNDKIVDEFKTKAGIVFTEFEFNKHEQEINQIINMLENLKTML